MSGGIFHTSRGRWSVSFELQDTTSDAVMPCVHISTVNHSVNTHDKNRTVSVAAACFQSKD